MVFAPGNKDTLDRTEDGLSAGGRPAFDWTPDAIGELTRLWAEGLTGSEIGRRMGMTKSAVVGKVHRLKLPGRPSPIKKTAYRAPAKIAAPKPNRNTLPVTPKSAKPQRRPMSTVNLPVGNSQCKWPIGHPDEVDFHFCTDKAVVGKPYCQDHYEQSVVRAKPGEAL